MGQAVPPGRTSQDTPEATERARERFISALAHDLANPLTAIRGTVQLLERRIRRKRATDEFLLSRLESVESAVTRVISRLDELVELALLRDDQVPTLERSSFDLVRLVKQLIASYRATSERHTFKVVAGAPAVVGEWDRSRVVRVMDNLLSNAIKYSPRGGTITLRVGLEPGASGDGGVETEPMAILEVQDEGIGIPEEERPNLFDRFRRASNVKDIPGTGVGLSSVRQIVEQHGGTITVQSRPNEGATFTIRLPLHAPAAAAATETPGR